MGVDLPTIRRADLADGTITSGNSDHIATFPKRRFSNLSLKVWMLDIVTGGLNHFSTIGSPMVAMITGGRISEFMCNI